MNYQDLDIYKLAHETVLQIHKLTITELPKFEVHEVGRQIRRSSKSTKSNIVEGYGRRRYKNDYIKFLTYAIASNDETIDHLKTLYETGSYRNHTEYANINVKLNLLGKQLNSFICTVEKSHRVVKKAHIED